MMRSTIEHTKGHTMNTITLIGPDFSTFVKSIELVCNYKGISYQLSLEHEGKPLAIKDDSLLQLHPYKKVPILIDGDFILPESNAIARYLEHCGGATVFDVDPQKHAHIDAWASMLSIYAFRALITDYIIEIKNPSGPNAELNIEKLKSAQPAVLNTLQTINTQLAERDFLITEQFSLADAIILPMLGYHMQLPGDLNLLAEFPNLVKYYQRISALPFCKGVLHTA